MTVENLEINVKTNVSGSSTQTIKILTDALGQLQAKAAALTGLSNLSSLATAMQTISGTSVKASAFSGIAKGIENLRSALSTLSSEDVARLSELSVSLKSLNGVDLSSLGSASNVARAAKGLKQTEQGIRNVGEAARKSKKHTSAFGASILRIFKYRMIRTAIKEIGQAFSEGLKIAYLFSAGLATISGRRFAEAMDTMNSKATQMKAQLGSAFIGLLAAIEPVVTKIIELIIRAADAVSQLIAAFTGTTYLRAAAVTDSLVDDFQSGTKAAKEWKNQLLGFDVINRLNEPSGGGAGGLTPEEMFEGTDTPISEKYLKIAEFIKKLIPDMETLKELAKQIGLLFLAWKLGSFFGKDLQQVVGIALMLYSAFQMVSDIIRALDEGLTWDNLKNLLLDVLGLAAGAFLAFGRVGAGIALVVGGAALIVAAFQDMKKNGMNLINTLTMIAGLLTAGLGISILTKSWIPMAIAAIASLVVALVFAFGEGEKFTQGMQKIFGGLGKFFKNIFKGDVEEAMKGLKEAWEGAKLVGQSVTNALRKAWQSFLDWIGERLGSKWRTLFEGAARAVSTFVGNNITGLNGLLTFITGVFTGDWEKAWEGVKGVLTAEVNHMLNIAGFFVNGFIDGINDIIDGLNALNGKIPEWVGFADFILPGVGTLLTTASKVSFNRIPSWTPPQFAMGGMMPNNGSLLVAGEAGPEIVANLGNSTGVMNVDQMRSAIKDGMLEAILASNRDGKTELHVYLDSREIKYGQSRLSRAMGV